MPDCLLNYWVQINGESCGPLSRAQLDSMLDEGTVGQDDLARREEDENWLPLALVLDRKASHVAPRTRGPGRTPSLRLPALLLILASAVALGLGGLWFVIKLNRTALQSSQRNVTEAKIQEVMGLLMTYRILAGSYPSDEQGLPALVSRPSTDPLPQRWEKLLDAPPLDSWGRALRYSHPQPETDQAPEVSSLGPDGLEGTADDIRSGALQR